MENCIRERRKELGLSQEERDKIARLNFQAVVKKTIG